VAISEVSQTADDTTSSNTYVDFATDMTVTPGAGDFLVIFSTSISMAASGDQHSVIALAKAGTVIAHTEREMFHEGSIDHTTHPYFHVTHAHVSLSAGQAINVKWHTTGGLEITARERTLVVFPITASEPTPVEITTDDTTSSASYVDIASTTITPGAGKYLAVFTSSWETPSSLSNELGSLAIHVNGTIVQHTERHLTMDSSIGSTSFPVLIAAIVDPGAGEPVAVKWKVVGGVTMTMHERTLTLYEVLAADSDEISQTGDDTTSSTTDVSFATAMKLTPGADDWLAIFSTSANESSTADALIVFTNYEDGSVLSHTIRETTGEDSLANADLPHGTASKIVLAGASEELETKWRMDDLGGAPTGLTSHERTLVAVREAAAVVDLPEGQILTNLNLISVP